MREAAESRPPQRRWRIPLLVGVAAVVTVGVALLTDRRSTPSVPPVPEIARQATSGRSVIFVGLDGVDWELLDRYAASGAMPNLAALVRDGTGGVLVSGQPMISPLIWTTMMTGVSPLEHRILDFTRFHPASGHEEPITSDERKAPAIWNMATWGGKRVAAFGLWASFPAEPVNGVLVSDRVLPFLFAASGSSAGLVFPPARIASVLEARERAEARIGLRAIHEYVPDAEARELERPRQSGSAWEHPVSALRRLLVETHLIHALAVDALRRDDPQLVIAYFEGTDAIAHVFAPFAPPRKRHVAEADYERFHRVPELYFRMVDEMLGEYRRLAQERHAVLMLASDHGFRWSEARPPRASTPAHSQAAEWHRREGLYLLWGAGIAPEPGHRGRGRVDQVAATLLELLGLPPDVKQVPLHGITKGEKPAVEYAAFYRPVPPQPPVGSGAETEALEKLRALGYVGGRAGSSPRPAGSTRTAGSHANECLILRLNGRSALAGAAAEQALVLDPRHVAALWCLSDVLLADSGQRDRSDELLVQAYALGLAEGVRYLAARARGYERAGDAARGARLLAAAAQARPQDAEIWLLRGRYSVDRGDCGTALEHYETATALSTDDPATKAGLGLAMLCSGDESRAREILKAAGTGPGEARLILAHGALARGELARAEREARRVRDDLPSELAAAIVIAQVEIGRARPSEALAHLDEARRRAAAAGVPPVADLELLRGDALARLGRVAEAEAALREEIRQFRQSPAAYVRLAQVLSQVGRPVAEIHELLEAMYAARPTREVASMAFRMSASLGDAGAAEVWRRRAATPGAALDLEP
jgi:tetratricopeptide (TPR) repeat protein